MKFIKIMLVIAVVIGACQYFKVFDGVQEAIDQKREQSTLKPVDWDAAINR